MRKRCMPMQAVAAIMLCLVFTLSSCSCSTPAPSETQADSSVAPPGVSSVPPLSASSALSVSSTPLPPITIQFTERDDVIANPLIGFAPSAQHSDAAGSSMLTHVQITWRDWEPEKGRYDTNFIEQFYKLSSWRNAGKRVVLRFVCDIPGGESHADIPKWLYDETGGDGTWYDASFGRGYSPNYDNSYFIERHRMALEALGAYLGQDSFVAYVQLGSIGHWGEWLVGVREGVPPLPTHQVISEYVRPYLSAFPNAKLMMRRPFTWVAEHGLGMFNDMAGHPGETEVWLHWINNGGTYEAPSNVWSYTAVPNIWDRSPIGGEFANTIPMEVMLGSNLGETLRLLDATHMTFIGPKIPRPERTPGLADSSINAVLKKLGYRFILSEATVDLSVNGQISVELCWGNTGVAPMYWNWPVFLYLIDKNGAVVQKQQVDIALTSLLPGAAPKTNTTLALSQPLASGGKIGIGIEDPQTGRPSVTFAINCEIINNIMIIGTY